MNQDGFTKIRNGLNEHVIAGQFSLTDLGVYLFLHMNKDWRTDICWTNGQSIATIFKTARSTINHSFQKLQERGYILYPAGTGSRANYPVLLVNGEPTHGLLKGARLIGWGDETYSSVEYDPVNADWTESQRSLVARWTEAGRWSQRTLDGRWTVVVPLPDLQTFKTFKTLPDIQDGQDEQTPFTGLSKKTSANPYAPKVVQEDKQNNMVKTLCQICGRGCWAPTDNPQKVCSECKPKVSVNTVGMTWCGPETDCGKCDVCIESRQECTHEHVTEDKTKCLDCGVVRGEKRFGQGQL